MVSRSRRPNSENCRLRKPENSYSNQEFGLYGSNLKRDFSTTEGLLPSCVLYFHSATQLSDLRLRFYICKEHLPCTVPVHALNLSNITSKIHITAIFLIVNLLTVFCTQTFPDFCSNHVPKGPGQIEFCASRNWASTWSTILYTNRSPSPARWNLIARTKTTSPSVLSPSSIFPPPSSHCAFRRYTSCVSKILLFKLFYSFKIVCNSKLSRGVCTLEPVGMFTIRPRTKFHMHSYNNSLVTTIRQKPNENIPTAVCSFSKCR